METAKLTSQKFLDLPTYSLSNPTGVVIGKQWKREVQGVWYLCEYVACDAPGYVDITKKVIAIENESQLTPRAADAGNGWQNFTRWLCGLFTPRR
jgi:hypothetical protein